MRAQEFSDKLLEEYDISSLVDSNATNDYVEILLGNSRFLEIDFLDGKYVVTMMEFEQTHGVKDTVDLGETSSDDELFDLVHSRYLEYTDG